MTPRRQRACVKTQTEQTETSSHCCVLTAGCQAQRVSLLGLTVRWLH